MKLYIDMDATLVDFAAQVTKLGLWRKNKPDKVAWDKVIKIGPSFWSEMEWMPGAEDAFNELRSLSEKGVHDLYILSAVNFPQGVEGKKLWVKTRANFPLEKTIIVPKAEDKAAYADGGSILVDDNKETADLFEASGGYSILFTGDWSEVLRKILTTFF